MLCFKTTIRQRRLVSEMKAKLCIFVTFRKIQGREGEMSK